MHIMFAVVILNLKYFTGIVNLIYDWSRCVFSFCYSNFLF